MTVKLVDNKLKIEKGIPAPHKRRDYSIIKQLQPGDSVFIPGLQQANSNPLIRRCRIAYGWTFTVKQYDGGLRIWRLS